MPLATLDQVLDHAKSRGGYAVGMVCLGYEEAKLFVDLGQELDVPIILQAGPGARNAMPVALWGKIFGDLADASGGLVVAHLDHGRTIDECQAGLDAGFSSIMFDGSQLPLDQNIKQSQQVADACSRYNASLEVEVGHVGYAGDPQGERTNPEELQQMANALPNAAYAVSIGNIHLQTKQLATIDWARADECSNSVNGPMVIHGGSGVRPEDRLKLAQDHNVLKFNIGTEMRQAAGTGMRNYLTEGGFDKLAALKASVDEMRPVATALLKHGWRL